MLKNNLAFFGGKMTINAAKPHWKWPPISASKTKAINEYYKNEDKFNQSYNSIKLFENNFKKFFKRKFAVTANSGTSCLLASFFSLNLQTGDEVIAPAMTFHSTATPIIQANGTPVFCDCEKSTGNIDPSEILKKISKKTKAIVITHLCGHPCEMDEIINIVKKYNLYLIEDCSHAHGSTYKNKKVGQFGHLAIFSLDANKLISTGEGGILLTNDRNLYERSLIITDFGLNLEKSLNKKENKNFMQTGLGYKHRMHPISSIIGLHELKNINKYIKLRNKKLNYLSNKLKKISGITPPVTKKYVHRGSFFGYRFFYDKKMLSNISQDKFIKMLRAEGLEVRKSGNEPLHLLNFFKKNNGGADILKINKKFLKKYKKGDFPNSELFYNTTLSLPTFTFETYKLIDLYAEGIRKVCNYLNK